ncbi:MAG: extracellular solute-binding protein [Intestinibacillus sp.]
MNRRLFSARLNLLLLCVPLLLLAGCGNKYGLNADKPVTITVWHYYNGAQQQAFDKLVSQFNATVGAKSGIIVDASSEGNVDKLTAKMAEALDQKVGADPVPNIIAAYADTAYAIDARGMATDISAYMTKEELARYLPSYLQEGYFTEGGGLKLLPIAKSTEVLMLNKTDWESFAAATGASEDSLRTWEGLFDVAHCYYQWTDSLTPDVPNDGRAFFGRDAMANYMIIGSMQLGHELFNVHDGQVTFDIDEDAMYRLWQCFYVPYINGWYTESGRFRSDDVKTGDILALVGSISGATYFPSEVTRPDGSAYHIETSVYPVPNFKGTRPYAVQQGAGMLVVRSDEAHEYASTVFLKWFTQPENNLAFSVGSGYLPITKKASAQDAVSAALDEAGVPSSATTRQVLMAGVATTQSYTLYTSAFFTQGSAARTIADHALLDAAKADRAAVEASMAKGLSHEAAVAPFVTRAHFTEWLESFRNQLASLL